MHWMSTRTHYVDGQVQNHIAYHGTVAVALSWVLQVMPLLFLTGGVANTAIIDRLTQGTFSYGQYLSARVARMTTPVIGLVALFLPLVWVINFFMPGMGDLAGEKLGLVLWFLAVYIVVIAAAPLAVRLHDRSPWLPFGVLGAVIAGVDYVRFAHGFSDISWVNLAAVWLFAHQLGVVYYRRSVARTSSIVLVGAAVASAVGIVTLVQVAGYPVATISTVGHTTSNMGLPTGAIALLAVAQFCVLVFGVRVARRFNVNVVVPRKQLNVANNAMMGVYLWHVPVYLIMAGVAMMAPTVLLPADEAGFWASRPVWFVVGVVLLVPALAFAAWWETLWRRCVFTSSAVKALVAAGLASFAIGYIWRNGIGLDASDVLGVGPLLASMVLNVAWSPRDR